MPYKDRANQYAAAARWRLRNLDKSKAYAASYAAAHRDQVRAAGRRYDTSHHEKRRAQWSAYRNNNAEKLRQSLEEYRRTHREQQRSYSRIRRQEHPETVRAIEAKYRETHRLRERAKYSLRRARKRALPATLTGDQWQAILIAYKGRCAYCGIKSSKLTQDHVIPLSKGGGTTPDNIVPACASCNSAKRDRSPVLIPAIRLLI